MWPPGRQSGGDAQLDQGCLRSHCGPAGSREICCYSMYLGSSTVWIHVIMGRFRSRSHHALGVERGNGFRLNLEYAEHETHWVTSRCTRKQNSARGHNGVIHLWHFTVCSLYLTKNGHTPASCRDAMKVVDGKSQKHGMPLTIVSQGLVVAGERGKDVQPRSPIECKVWTLQFICVASWHDVTWGLWWHYCIITGSITS